jgi:hypothetical protein
MTRCWCQKHIQGHSTSWLLPDAERDWTGYGACVVAVASPHHPQCSESGLTK